MLLLYCRPNVLSINTGANDWKNVVCLQTALWHLSSCRVQIDQSINYVYYAKWNNQPVNDVGTWDDKNWPLIVSFLAGNQFKCDYLLKYDLKNLWDFLFLDCSTQIYWKRKCLHFLVFQTHLEILNHGTGFLFKMKPFFQCGMKDLCLRNSRQLFSCHKNSWLWYQWMQCHRQKNRKLFPF